MSKRNMLTIEQIANLVDKVPDESWTERILMMMDHKTYVDLHSMAESKRISFGDDACAYKLHISEDEEVDVYDLVDFRKLKKADLSEFKKFGRVTEYTGMIKDFRVVIAHGYIEEHPGIAVYAGIAKVAAETGSGLITIGCQEAVEKQHAEKKSYELPLIRAKHNDIKHIIEKDKEAQDRQPGYEKALQLIGE